MALVGQAVSEKKIFEIVDGRTDGRTTDHDHPISSPCEPNGSGELTRETGKGKSDIKQEKATSQIGKTITNGDNMPDLNQPAHFLHLDCIKNKGASPNYNLTRTTCDSCKFEIKKEHI